MPLHAIVRSWTLLAALRAAHELLIIYIYIGVGNGGPGGQWPPHFFSRATLSRTYCSTIMAKRGPPTHNLLPTPMIYIYVYIIIIIASLVLSVFITRMNYLHYHLE